MNPIELIREQRKQSTLRELSLIPHRKRIMHLENIRSVGIIANNLSEDDHTILSQLTHHWTSKGVMVRKIELPALADDLLDKSGLPKRDFTILFTSYKYDLLIDTTQYDDDFGLFVTLNTQSSLRTGYQDTSMPENKIATAAYDFIIRGNGPLVLKDFLTDLLSYLTQIRK